MYLKQEEHALALPLFARVVAMDPPHQQARHFLPIAASTPDDHLAIHDLEKLKESNPRDEQILFLLGFAHLKNGDADAAKSIFNQMFEVAGRLSTNSSSAVLRTKPPCFRKPRKAFCKYSNRSRFPGLHRLQASFISGERRTDDAVRELGLAIKEKPSNEEASYFLGALLVQRAHIRRSRPLPARGPQTAARFLGSNT